MLIITFVQHEKYIKLRWFVGQHVAFYFQSMTFGDLWVTYKIDALLFGIICSRGIPHDGFKIFRG